jgi:hypothetical protein
MMKNIDMLILMNDLQQLMQPSSTAVGVSVPSSEDFQRNRTQNLANVVGSIRPTPYFDTEEGKQTVLDMVTGSPGSAISTPLAAGPLLYKGISKWIPGSMVKKGKFVGGGHYSTHPNAPLHGKGKPLPKESLWTTTSKDVAEGYSRRQNWTPNKSIVPKGEVLEFDVPHSYIDKLISEESALKSKGYAEDLVYLFLKGLPKEYFKKRIK